MRSHVLLAVALALAPASLGACKKAGTSVDATEAECASYRNKLFSLLPAEEQAAMAMLPSWSTAAFAIGVFAGLLGSLGLLLAKSWSRLLLLLSLLALIALEGWFVFMTDAVATMGPSTYVMPALIVGIAILLVWVANTAAKRGWLT